MHPQEKNQKASEGHDKLLVLLAGQKTPFSEKFKH
jgi:hypothetical protein